MTNKALIETIKADIRRKVNGLIDEYEELVKYEVWIDANKLAIKIKLYKEVLSYLDTLPIDEKKGMTSFNDIMLKQEQPKVDLELEIERIVNDEEEFMNFQAKHQLIGYVARHFYELGLNARKEE